ncbi:hypothetical protein [Allostreptomyces psammosilenae]|uniref:Type VII secretion system (Wss) protein ESAT-6 n=1 Tax=Allostreptomyces psammosilenae TaxID=1892865 RepID=A0A852ZZ18_9ACTN|nr:hypothetical protein [Allostreptomyces psammosilenae]NYI06470.1 hypothetical protein [Allostreptomyces psammosilenae]
MNFTDTSEPTSNLTAPQAPGQFSSPLTMLNQASDLISPTYWVMEICNMALGFNPMNEAKEWFAGDWEAYMKCGDAWGKLAACCDGIAANISAGNQSLDGAWHGNAADSAYVYFDELARNIREIKSSLEDMKGQYESAAHGIWMTGELVGAIIGRIGDQAATAAIAAAAGSLMSWTGAGAMAGYGVAAMQILEIINLWGEATKQINNAQMIVNGVYGQLENIGMEVAAQLEGFPLPADSYDSPVV